MVEDDPFLALAKAEVVERLRHDFNLIESHFSEGGVTTKDEVYLALDESKSNPKVWGFATVKVGVPQATSATIAYIAVEKDNRGQGVFGSIIEEIKKLYTVVAIDCPIRLVPLYEKFGFKVEKAYSTHILMTTGRTAGQSVVLQVDKLLRERGPQQALRDIRAQLKTDFSQRLDEFNSRNGDATREAEDFVASYKLQLKP